MITTSTKTKLLSLLAVGLCDALRDETIDILEAERLLFSPHTMQQVRRCDKRIVELIHMGTELDDIKTLVPSDYEGTISRIRKLALACLADNANEVDPTEKPWIDSIV